MLVHIYCRVSSKLQADDNCVSLDQQEDTCRKYCDKKGWIVGNVVKDVCSARNKIPTGLFYLYNKIKNDKGVDEKVIILVYNVTRYSRNVLEGLKFVETLKDNNILLRSVNEKIDLSCPRGRNAFNLALCKSQEESDIISERVTNAFKFIKSKGGKLGVAPYGMKAIRNKDNLRIFEKDKYEQKVIDFICKVYRGNITSREVNKLMNKISSYKDLIEIYDQNGEITRKLDPYMMKYQEIADLLNDYKVKSRNNKKWNKSNISRIIFNNRLQYNIVGKGVLKKVNLLRSVK